jgi:hypothetical protein
MLLKAKGTDLYPIIKKLHNKEFVILPCASELSELANDGNCDLMTGESMDPSKYAPENFPSCSTVNTKLGKPCGMLDSHLLNWSYYLQFYGGKVRSELFGTLTGIKRQCRNTNMLANVLEFIKNYANPMYAPSQPMDAPLSTPFRGGKLSRKKRKTKRKL